LLIVRQGRLTPGCCATGELSRNGTFFSGEDWNILLNCRLFQKKVVGVEHQMQNVSH
jgi:hypothetical protein